MKHLYTSNSNSPWVLLAKCAIFSIPFLVGLLFFYFTFYRDFACARDLGRLGMMCFDKDYKDCVDTLTENHVKEIKNTEFGQCSDSISILSIGDSFSQQGRRGYLNYLAETHKGYKYFNLYRSFDNPEEEFIRICLEDSLLPKIVILESVERSFIGRLCSLNFSEDSVKQRNNLFGEETAKNKKKSFVQWAQEYYKKKLGIDNPVGYFPLSAAVFSCRKHEKDLFFINDKGYGNNYIDSDLDMPNSDLIKLAQLKLDSLFQFATNHDITLFYLVATDKYDAYQEFISIDHPKKSTLDDFANHFKDNIYFINSKNIILPAINSGEKDMYYCDDTHWSTKSAKLVGEELAKRINYLH